MNALNTTEHMQTLGLQAKQASSQMAKASAAVKNHALRRLAALLRENVDALQVNNAKDLERARAAGLAEPMVDRLKLTPKVLETCAQGCEQLAAMPDVIGEIIGMKQQPSGIRVGQMRVPIGVFGMIFESRPNVTIEAASLSIKSGNACILRGGSEAIDSNKALARLVQQALADAGNPAGVPTISTGSAVGGTVLGQVQSQPVKTLIAQMLPNSDNMLGEMLARVTSKQLGLDGSTASLTLAQVNDAPTITVTQVNNFIEDDGAAVGDIVASYTTYDEEGATVTVTLSDDMRFTPANWQATSGETVRIQLVNAGKVRHEFIIGTEVELQAHAEEMKKPNTGHNHHASNAVSVAAGATGELVWTFTDAGVLQIACFEPGHFEAGMRGSVSVLP